MLQLSDYVVNSTPVLWSRPSDTEIVIQARKGYLLVKEAYFPNWHAYQDGKELSVFPSYHGLMIIKSESDSTVRLLFQPHFSEVIGLFIYLLLISFLISYLYMSKQSC